MNTYRFLKLALQNHSRWRREIKRPRQERKNKEILNFKEKDSRPQIIENFMMIIMTMMMIMIIMMKEYQ
jgi:hypothetical protein